MPRLVEHVPRKLHDVDVVVVAGSAFLYPCHARMIGLTCHPDTPSAAVRGIRAGVSRRRPEVLDVSYAIEGELAQLLIPARRPARFVERLWQHSCCEVFVARRGESAYREFNFSPSGEWAAYAFSGYREGAPMRNGELDPGISVRASARELRLDASVACPPGRLQLGISAVIEEANGALSYWALRHAPGKQDFHHPDAFALELD